MRNTRRGWLARHGGRHPAGDSAGNESRVHPDTPAFPFAYTADETIPERARGQAAAVVAHASRFAPRPILFARMTLRTQHDPAASGRVVASALLDVNGEIVLAHATADTVRDALDLIEARLCRSVEKLSDLRRTRRRERTLRRR